MSAIFDELQNSSEIVFITDEEQAVQYFINTTANYYIL